jgi:hypothetical protein
MAMRNRLLLAASPLAASLLSVACPSISGPSTLKTYTGQYSVQVVESTVTVSLQGGGTFPCTNTYTMSGTITLKVDQSTWRREQRHRRRHPDRDRALHRRQLQGERKPVHEVVAETQRVGQRPELRRSARRHKRRLWRHEQGDIHRHVIERRRHRRSGLSVSGSGVIGGTASVSQNYSTTVNVTLR